MNSDPPRPEGGFGSWRVGKPGREPFDEPTWMRAGPSRIVERPAAPGGAILGSSSSLTMGPSPEGR